MRYYTKSWYNLLQQTNDTSLLTPIPDNPYSDSDIQIFYDIQLSNAITQDQKEHASNPTLEYLEQIINTEPFDPEDCYAPDYNTGTYIHLDTIDKARAWIEKEKEKHHHKRYPI